MHSGTLERLNTPRKRTLSRGMSEDESLRHIIKETEGSARRLMRADSRPGPVKKLDKSESQSEEDLIMRTPEMLDLQDAYNETLQELRSLELQREALVFQVDCLQDTLESAEEMLAEAQWELRDTKAVLEQERQSRMKLEDTVGLLVKELEKVRADAVPKADTTDSRGQATLKDGTSLMEAPLITAQQDLSFSGPGFTQGIMETLAKGSSETTPNSTLHFIRENKVEQSSDEEGSSHPLPLGGVLQESSVDSDDLQCGTSEIDPERKEAAASGMTTESPLAKFQRLVQKTLSQWPTLSPTTSPPQDGIIQNSRSSPGGMSHEAVLAQSSSQQHDTAVLQAPLLDDTLCESHKNIPDTTPTLAQAASNEDSSASDYPKLEGGDAEKKVHSPPSASGELLSSNPPLEAVGLKNPDQCILS